MARLTPRQVREALRPPTPMTEDEFLAVCRGRQIAQEIGIRPEDQTDFIEGYYFEKVMRARRDLLVAVE